MDRVCSSRKDERLFIDPNMEDFHEILNSDHQQESPLYSGFPSPFFDDIPLLTKNNTHQHHHRSPNKPLNITSEPLPSESKRQKKRRSLGKKDRHSKIHTAQGLRDRRMRLSLHIARKFFDLQDLLGYDKASKTIEWLFCKSNKAIKEVAQNFYPQLAMISEDNCEEGLTSEIKSFINKPENSKELEKIKNRDLKKQVPNNSSVRETRDQARARARDRTRERLMIKELEKSKQLFGGNAEDDEIYKLGLGYLASPNNHHSEELGFTSSLSEPILQESSSPSLEHSSIPHLLPELQSATTDVNNFENYSLINHDPPAGWLNSSNGLLGMPGEWDIAADRFITEYYNYEMAPTTAPLTGNINEQNPSSFFMSTTTNILQYFQSQNQGK